VRFRHVKKGALMPLLEMGELLFVYGTLRKDSQKMMNPMLAHDSTYVGDARIQGELYDLGTYPGVFLNEGCADIVMGEVYALNPQHASRTWQVLDHYEGCGPDDDEPHAYRRRKVRAFLNDGNEVDAWAYFLTSLPAKAVRIPNGDYLSCHRKAQ
jgi:gamma-glutamylcyclotransferase (GGCT)/AIG2-like uncharacterized protein YtfP